MEAVLIAACIYAPASHYDKGKCTIHLIQGILDGIDTRNIVICSLLLDKMRQNLSIGRRLKKASLVFQFIPQLTVIHYASIIGHCKIT